MPQNPKSHLTELLNRGARGDGDAWDELMPRVYAELRSIADARMAGERDDHTLQPTALVHEAYVKLVGNQKIEWRDRAQFLNAAAESMRRILIDHARRNQRLKRPARDRRVPLNLVDLASQDDPDQVRAVDDAIQRLAAEDELAGQVVRLRFFAGLTIEEAAQALGISKRTAVREWTYARARLFRMLESGEEKSG